MFSREMERLSYIFLFFGHICGKPRNRTAMAKEKKEKKKEIKEKFSFSLTEMSLFIPR